MLGSAEQRRRPLLRFAPLISAAGLVLPVAIGPIADGGAPVIAGIAVGFVLLGWGIGTAWPHLVTTVLSTVPSDEGDLAGASITTVQLTAVAAGAAIGGAVTNLAGFADAGSLVGAQDAARWLYIAMLAAPLLALVTVRLATRREPRRIAPAAAPHQRTLQPAAGLDGSLRYQSRGSATPGRVPARKRACVPGLIRRPGQLLGGPLTRRQGVSFKRP